VKSPSGQQPHRAASEPFQTEQGNAIDRIPKSTDATNTR
jgi:hypothetical protein